MNTINHHTTFTPEQDRAISNRAWLIFNAALNEGKVWAVAKNACIAQIKQARSDFDQSFNPFTKKPEDPMLARLEWETRMDQFNRCLYFLNDIP